MAEPRQCRVPSCGCVSRCGDDGDTEGPGVCKGLPLPPKSPLVEIVLLDRRKVHPAGSLGNPPFTEPMDDPEDDDA